MNEGEYADIRLSSPVLLSGIGSTGIARTKGAEKEEKQQPRAGLNHRQKKKKVEERNVYRKRKSEVRQHKT